MSIARVTTQGRVTIPADVRLAMQAKPGDRIEFVEVEPNRFVLFKARIGKTPAKPSSSRTASMQKV
jgi:AbrB family looped-hinge helix DNA binding protein